MDLTKIPERSEIPEEFTWDLRDIFPDDEAWQAEYRALLEAPAALAAFAGTLAERPGRLLDFLKLDDELTVRLEKLMGYASCKSDQNLADSSALDRRSKATAARSAPYMESTKNRSTGTPDTSWAAARMQRMLYPTAFWKCGSASRHCGSRLLSAPSPSASCPPAAPGRSACRSTGAQRATSMPRALLRMPRSFTPTIRIHI